ncbi:DHH family phosphoesterase [Sulfolobus sp. E5-1-F]|uniref:DHH family phosphoesterase n=1 Tax=Sulfolobaceae TaxID=118883 RepID=UPI001296BA8C|nr:MULTISPECIES: DHH family phosphoesterase [unclassified Sulfolobus]QGA53592.1 DHH family phosphoesterase [Sulfolobus sp. E5-1-F]QGA68743.1 DHH family phosphoesterase [Sulfolobus sp. E11-6]
MEYYAIVHNDFDGTASAAIYARAVKSLPKNVFFTEPNKLHSLLASLELRGVYNVMIADLGINASTFNEIIKSLKKLIEQGANVEWFDHHVWKDEWKEELKKIGVSVYHDTSTCGAGVIYKYKNPNDEFSRRLASADCSVDIWLHDDPMGEKLRRIVENNKDYSWKNELIRMFYNGILWNDTFDKMLEEVVSRELEGYKKVMKSYKLIQIDGYKVVVAVRWKGPPDISYASQFLMTRTNASVFVSANGKSISFRSKEIDVRQFAVKLGGGGHPLAAGAQLKVPLIYRFLNRLGIKGPMLNWVTKVVQSTITDVGFVIYQDSKKSSTSSPY